MAAPGDVPRPAGAGRPGRPVVLDAMGGDHGPAETVPGALAAHREEGVRVLLVGDRERVGRELRRHGGAGELEVVHTDGVVPMADAGARAAARPATSLMVGCELARREGAAFVSAGATGAVVTCAVRVLGRAPGVLRPALAVALPTATGSTVLVDAGGTADPTAPMLAQFAVLGCGHARAALGVPDPLVGLLSIGSEPGKGNRLVREAARLLPDLPVRFHGNVEGHDVLAGTVDVVATDGFTGNVVLKNIEGCARTVLGMAARGGADPEALARVGRLYSADAHGGAALLGLDGSVIVAHGSSGATAIARACAVAATLTTVDLLARSAAEGRT
ncbi:phosphate acyltransferase [Actinomadura sp. WMMB 499]|uniref:phosphate acyltransferase n=1 Tax=Actinomadura sp. WMMB 499 TaxID=1219491 RepID=UPI001247E093|nr:phosphate acyltransferase PlsX [Actinomadura sp. WMMB 499]QFG22440.1 phosphate acyltransferase PlsX [Actinomadura sp. WMMB 499]